MNRIYRTCIALEPVIYFAMLLARHIRLIVRIGPIKLIGLFCRKLSKRARYERMLRMVPRSKAIARWKGITSFEYNDSFEADRDQILARAEAMLRDENIFFSFPYQLRGIEKPWEYDPLEKKYWPRRHYSERMLHAADTPRDAKIVWEINRFKDLPTLAQATVLTGDAKYAEEAERRMISWIEENSFASTINWASALEISIRLIAWTTTMALPSDTTRKLNPKIARSIYEQSRYLAGDLSTDRVVPTNHLIGEAAGLYIVSSLWDFPGCRQFARQGKQILEHEILRQTFPDGVTREASSWYHLFVTDFCDLADRVARAVGDEFDEKFHTRLADMKAFLERMTVAGSVVRYGDADDGWALFLAGDRNAWKRAVFGPARAVATKPSILYHPDAKLVAARAGESFFFLRAGEFGMGGAGFASHAHDDFLSPIIYLAGRNILADPGTFVYNGDPARRTQYRGADAHNGIVIGSGTGGEQRLNFGWNRVRPDAKILEADSTGHDATVIAQYSEWPQHCRTVKLRERSVLISDRFVESVGSPCTWGLHLAPEWAFVDNNSDHYRFQNSRGDRLSVKLRGNFESIELATYDYSPSYRVAMPGTMLRFSALNPSGTYAILMSIELAAIDSYNFH